MEKTFNLLYGNKDIQISIAENREIDVIEPNYSFSSAINYTDIRNEINKYFTMDKSFITDWSKLNLIIVLNDKTRPVPNNLLLPPLLSVLNEKGVMKNNIKFLIASGTHTPMRKEEYYLILPEEIVKTYKIYSHNCDEEAKLTYKGVTSRGTPVYVNSLFDDATIKIVVGDIEPHHFAGFSGGVKGAAIGLAGRKTINANHTFFTDENAKVGNYQSNPLRQDIEEIGQLIGVDFALNAILDEEKTILKVFFGRPLEVIKNGIKFSRTLSFVPTKEHYDLVISSAGGYPKDINFYQAQKALTHASLFCKPNGMVFLVAQCIEGIGSEKYVQFMKGLSSYTEVIDKFESVVFEVGPHKAYQVARIASKIRFKLFSSIKLPLLSELLIESIISIDEEIKKYIDLLPLDAKILILPYATATIPEYEEENVHEN